MKPTLRILVYIWIASMFLLVATSCNSVKHVLKNDQRTQKVVDSYILKHPFKNDTIITYVSGVTDTVILKTSYLDSANQQVPCDSFRVVTPQGTVISVDKYRKLKIQNDSLVSQINTHRTDTLKQDVVDRSLLITAQNLAVKLHHQIEALQSLSAKQEATIKDLNKDLYIAGFKVWAMIALVVFYFVYRFYRKLPIL